MKPRSGTEPSPPITSSRPLPELAEKALGHWREEEEHFRSRPRGRFDDSALEVAVVSEVVELGPQRFAVHGDRAWELLSFTAEGGWAYQPALLPDGSAIFVGQYCEGGRVGLLHFGQSEAMRQEGQDPITITLSSWIYTSELQGLHSGAITPGDMTKVIAGKTDA